MSNLVSVGKTDFPLRPDPAARGSLSHFSCATHGDFRLLDGPPYANGAPHLGHVLNKHLKDAVARAANASGQRVEWRPGWDCHGLPLELAVERLGVARSDRSLFVASARGFAREQACLQSGVFQQQGWSAQWDKPWHTQDPQMEAGTLRVLAQLLDRGLLEVKFTAVPWCPQCQSTVANAEQEDRPVQSTAWLVPFELDDGDCLLSWTTTPWTLPLHQALVVNPHARYVRLEKESVGAWVSEDTAQSWALRLGATTGRACLGSDLAGRPYASPWMRGLVQSDGEVLPGAGTGALHAVAGLSELDTVLAHRHGWEVVQHLSPEGCVMGSPCAEENGLPAGPLANAVVRGVYSTSPWFQELPYAVEQAHCWRHGVPLLTRASRQVFLRLDDAVRARAEQMLSHMEFSPPQARTRLVAAMRDRPAWCLSRQRTWGVPLALFLDRATGQPHALASTFMRRVADAVEQDGVEAWWSAASDKWLQADVDLAAVERVDDVLDVWFDSGCVPQLVGNADVVVEGTDQHRGWFQSCVWLAASLGADLPFKRVACHGFVVDQSGEKLSKSKGGDAKTEVASWSSLPTDVVRVWALSGTDGNDKAWTQETVQLAQGMLARWRGVVRFLLANLLPMPADLEMFGVLPAWDRYWLGRAQTVSRSVCELVAAARFGEAVSLASEFGEAFSSHALGSWKDRLYCAPAATRERQALDLALRGCLQAWGTMMEVLAPRLRCEAQSYWPVALDLPAVELSEAECAEVEEVVKLRAALGPFMERMNKDKKGGPGLRRVSLWTGAPSWPGQLLADALDVGQVVAGEVGLEPLDLPVGSHVVHLSLGVSPDPACPRCRRAQPEWTGEFCGVCAARLAGRLGV